MTIPPLRDRVYFERPDRGLRNDFGEPTPGEWVAHCSRLAALTPTTGREVYVAGQSYVQASYELICRGDAETRQIDESYRVMIDGDYYEVFGIEFMTRDRRWMKIQISRNAKRTDS